MKYDVIVIGAGSAGCVVAGRLSEETNLAVLLLEAGPDYPDFEHYPDDLKFGYSATASARRWCRGDSTIPPAHRRIPFSGYHIAIPASEFSQISLTGE